MIIDDGLNYKRLLSEIHSSHPVEQELVELCFRTAGVDGPRTRLFAIPSPVPGNLGGKYFPSKNSALVYRHGDRWIYRATCVHETAHGISYPLRCRTFPKKSTKCGYSGQHDATFYKLLRRLYEAAGIPPRIAIQIESLCKGEYQCPADWLTRASW